MNNSLQNSKISEQPPTYYVDFDYTLFGTNSTDAFLRTARPYALFWLMFTCINKLIPWRAIGKSARFKYADMLCCNLLRLMNPFAMRRFRAKAPAMFERHKNPELLTRLKDVPDDQIVIVSFGMAPVLRALLASTRFEECKIVAPGFLESAGFRSRGKLAALQAQGHTVKSTDIVLTDNFEDDHDLVSAVDKAELIKSDAALDVYDQPYVPFFYTAKIKRTPSFLIKQIFLEEFPIVLLAYGLTQGLWPDLRLWVCLGFLFTALILVYEIGYAENDRIGEQAERNPKLTEGYFKYKSYRLQPQAWIYALLATLAGFACLGLEAREAAILSARLPLAGALTHEVAALTAIWMAVLVLVRVFFGIFNGLAPWLRVYWYVPLHAVKYLGFAVLFALPLLGQVLIFAHIVRTWALYAVRRAGGDMEALLSQTVRLVFVGFAFVVIALGDLSQLMNVHALLILGFCVVRAVPEYLSKAKVLS